eukprot:768105-Hanusia_phi.AAC.3
MSGDADAGRLLVCDHLVGDADARAAVQRADVPGDGEEATSRREKLRDEQVTGVSKNHLRPFIPQHIRPVRLHSSPPLPSPCPPLLAFPSPSPPLSSDRQVQEVATLIATCWADEAEERPSFSSISLSLVAIGAPELPSVQRAQYLSIQAM